MKIIKSMIFMIVILIAKPSMSAEWATIPGTDDQFDKSRIAVNKDGNVIVWRKTVWSDKAIKRIIDSGRRNGIYIDYSDYSYTLMLEEYNCTNKTARSKGTIHYANSGSAIFSTGDMDENYESIPPESTGEATLLAVCDSVTKNKKKK